MVFKTITPCKDIFGQSFIKVKEKIIFGHITEGDFFE